MLALTVQGALSGCTLDVHGLEAADAGIVGGDDAGMSVTIPDAGQPPPEDVSVDPPDASTMDVTMMVGTGCPSGAEVRDIPSSSKNSGNFSTTGPVCARYKGNVMGWGVSNGQGRMVTVVGATTTGPLDATMVGTAGAVDAGPDGFIYWILTAGSVNYVSVFVF
jgi:hypothetical protein